jgi:hypothetical protein
MKKSKTAFLFIFLVIFLKGSSYAVELNIKFSAGLSLLRSGEINRILADWKTWEVKNAESIPSWNYLGGDIQQFSSGFDFEGEILLSFHPRFMVSVGSGFFYGEVKPEKTELFIERPAGEFSYIHPYTVSAIPVTLSGYYLQPLSRIVKAFVKAGAGIAWAKYFERAGYKNLAVVNYTDTLNQNARARSPMFTGGGGFIFETEPGINFFVESSFRWARVSGFKGEYLEGQSGELFYLEEYDSDFDLWQSKFVVLSQKPEAENIRAVKKAVIDLSGFSIKLGFMIRF